MAILLFFVLLLLPLQCFSQPSNQKGGTKTREQIGKQEPTTPTNPTPLTIKKPGPKTNTTPTGNAEQQGANHEISSPWPLRSEWVMVWLTLLYTAVTVGMLIAIYNQNKAIMNRDRAWMLASIGPLPNFVPDPMKLEILYIQPMIENYGNTPAVIERMVMRLHQLEPDWKLPEKPVYEQDATGAVQRLDGPILIPPNKAIKAISLGIRASLFDEAAAMRRELYVYGLIEYRDVFGRTGSTQFATNTISPVVSIPTRRVST